MRGAAGAPSAKRRRRHRRIGCCYESRVEHRGRGRGGLFSQCYLQEGRKQALSTGKFTGTQYASLFLIILLWLAGTWILARFASH